MQLPSPGQSLLAEHPHTSPWQSNDDEQVSPPQQRSPKRPHGPASSRVPSTIPSRSDASCLTEASVLLSAAAPDSTSARTERSRAPASPPPPFARLPHPAQPVANATTPPTMPVAVRTLTRRASKVDKTASSTESVALLGWHAGQTKSPSLVGTGRLRAPGSRLQQAKTGCIWLT
jgi:hypothetical protein